MTDQNIKVQTGADTEHVVYAGLAANPTGAEGRHTGSTAARSDAAPRLPIMEAEAVSFGYPGGGGDALAQLSMRIPQGCKTAICGHNGSGKSTFFLHAIGIHRPAQGRMLWKGEPVGYSRDSLQNMRRRVGLVFQDPEQQLILNTPLEDVAYGLRNAGVGESEIAVRTEEMLAAMGLAELANTPIHHLSLGQKKRVALAGVLVLGPELLLLDEPTAYLDRISERKLLEELDRIHGAGVTVAMATHDMNLAYAWADWILVMDRGRCLMEGTPHDVFGQTETIASIGLEVPMLLELWQSLPEARRGTGIAPRTMAGFKRLLRAL